MAFMTVLQLIFSVELVQCFAHCDVYIFWVTDKQIQQAFSNKNTLKNSLVVVDTILQYKMKNTCMDELIMHLRKQRKEYGHTWSQMRPDADKQDKLKHKLR